MNHELYYRFPQSHKLAELRGDAQKTLFKRKFPG